MTTLLERDFYPIREAARLLSVPESTLRWWLEGQTKRGKTYLPVLRDQPSGSGLVTWGEFVEAGFLSAYRHKDVPLGEVRIFIDSLRQKLGIPYPLAHFRPFVSSSRRLVIDLQESAGLSPEFALALEVSTGQLVLSGASETFLAKVEFAPDENQPAVRVFPSGRKSPVVIDANKSFGAPNIRGIRTDVLAELVDAGEDPAQVAHDFGLTVPLVKAAVAFEWQWSPAA